MTEHQIFGLLITAVNLAIYFLFDSDLNLFVAGAGAGILFIAVRDGLNR